MIEHTKDRNIFILSKTFLEAQLKIRFPELEEIVIEKKFPKTLKVEIKMEKLVFKWIYSNTKFPENQYFGYVSKNGRFFLHGPEEIFTVFEEDHRTEFIEPVQEILSKKEIRKIQDAKIKLESILEKKLPKMKYLRKAQEIHFFDEEDTQYWIFLKKDIYIQIDKLERALIVKDIFSNPIEYVDMRIGRKIIYKKR